MNKSVTGIVIQGPLVSFGQGPNRCIDGLDTYNTIQKNIELLQRLQLKYVICTWVPSNRRETEVIKRLKKEGFNLLTLEVPKLADPDHRYKHHFAIKAGLDHLAREEVNFVIKIRTDMCFPEAIFKWLLEQMDLAPEKFVISELYDDGITVGDFLYCANIKVFDDFLTSVLRHQNFNIHPSVGADIGMKFLAKRTNIAYNFFHLPIWIYYPILLMRRKKHFVLWSNFIYDNLLILPEELWNNIVWRGKKMSEIMNSSRIFFYEDLVQKTVHPKTLNFRETVTKYRLAMSSYYMKRINKRLREQLLKIKSICVQKREVLNS